MLQIGITDTGDAGFQLDWAQRMDQVHGAILITRVLTPEFLQALTPFPARVLIHVACSGYGGTVLEPNIPSLSWTRGRYTTLVETIRPEQTVLRLSPIIPTPRGLSVAETVLKAFGDSPVQRVRYRCLELFPGVVARLQAARLSDPYEGAAGPRPGQLLALHALLARWEQRFQFESCAEPDDRAVGCLSTRDAEPLGFDPGALTPGSPVRRFCRCPANRVELLAAPSKCGQACLHCTTPSGRGTVAPVPVPTTAPGLATAAGRSAGPGEGAQAPQPPDTGQLNLLG